MSMESTLAVIQVALAELAPEGVISTAALVGAHDAELSETERRWVDGWGPHRRAEFATGRWCARHAMAQLGLSTGDLLADDEGLPQWPRGLAGCISHSRGLAAAIVARAEPALLLGLDLEKTNRLSAGAIQKVVHPLEQNFVAGDQVRASLLFSLKEAFYKAQFPRWRTPGNFHDMALTLDLTRGEARILQLDARFASDLLRLRFRFRLVDDYVVSLCWL